MENSTIHAALCTLLKEQCHEDFAVLGQFYAKNHYFEASNHKQNTAVMLG